MAKDKTETVTEQTETVSEFRQRLDEMEKALGLKPSDEDMQRLRSMINNALSKMEALEAEHRKLNEGLGYMVLTPSKKPAFSDLQEQIDAINCPPPHCPKFETLKCTRPAQLPTEDDGTLVLRFAPSDGQGKTVTKDSFKKLTTGVKLIVPSGYVCHVAQRRPSGSATILDSIKTYSAGTTSEIEILCTASEHDGTGRRIQPGDIIGCAWLERAVWSKANEG